MSSRFYAETMEGGERWQVVVEDIENERYEILGHNLDGDFACRLAEKLHAGMDELNEAKSAASDTHASSSYGP